MPTLGQKSLILGVRSAPILETIKMTFKAGKISLNYVKKTGAVGASVKFSYKNLCSLFMPKQLDYYTFKKQYFRQKLGVILNTHCGLCICIPTKTPLY